MPKSIKPAELLETIQKTISIFGNWDKDYLYIAVYDLQEKFIRKDLENWGVDYENG